MVGAHLIFVEFRSFDLIKYVYVLTKALFAVSEKFILYLKVDINKTIF